MLLTKKLATLAFILGSTLFAAGCAETGSVGSGSGPLAPVLAGGGHDDSRSDFPKVEKKHDAAPGRVSVGGDPNAAFGAPLGRNPRARRF